jgi:hypothetical protein
MPSVVARPIQGSGRMARTQSAKEGTRPYPDSCCGKNIVMEVAPETVPRHHTGRIKASPAGHMAGGNRLSVGRALESSAFQRFRQETERLAPSPARPLHART